MSKTADERALVARTLAGDPAAFGTLVDRHHASFLRLAAAWGHGAAAAQEAVRASWAAILDGLAGFRFDRPLRTWMMGVVASRARRRCEDGPAEVAGGRERFDAAGRWTDPPARWDERAPAARDVEAALASLPCLERVVVTLRDVEGLGADEACAVLDVAMSRQCALLHRGRSRLRQALEERLRGVAGAEAT